MVPSRTLRYRGMTQNPNSQNKQKAFFFFLPLVFCFKKTVLLTVRGRSGWKILLHSFLCPYLDSCLSLSLALPPNWQALKCTRVPANLLNVAFLFCRPVKGNAVNEHTSLLSEHKADLPPPAVDRPPLFCGLRKDPYTSESHLLGLNLPI